MYLEEEIKTVFTSSLHKYMLVPVFSVSTTGAYFSLKIFSNRQGNFRVFCS